MDQQQSANLPAINAMQETLAGFYPHNITVERSNTYTPSLFAQCCADHADGMSEREIGKKYGIPMSLLWRWSSIPGLCDIWREARKQYSYAVMVQAREAADSMMRGYRIDPLSGQPSPLGKYDVGALDRAGRLLLDIATKLNPDEFAERLQVDKRQITTTYVVGLSPDMPIGGEADTQCTIDVPAPDKAGVERANLPQTWREKLSRERRRKRESSNQDE